VTDFLLENYSIITHSVEFLAAITGVFYYKKYKNVVAKYFIFFLIFVSICDFLGGYVYYVRPDKFLNFLIGTKIQKNHWFSTLSWDIGAVLFYSYYFFKILQTRIYKKIIKYVACGFFLFSIIYIAFHWEQFFYQFFTVLDVLGAIVICLCSILYFIEILVRDKILEFYKSISFYISATIFIWWLIITPLTFYSEYFTYEVGKNFYDLDFVSLRRQIYLLANIFMYLTFTFAFIWCKPEKN
jgi:hypothetical protein